MRLDEDYETVVRYVAHIIAVLDKENSSIKYTNTSILEEQLLETLIFHRLLQNIDDQTFVDKLVSIVQIENLKALNFLQRVKDARKYIDGLRQL